VETPDYVQITGTGVFTNTNVQAGDTGGELVIREESWILTVLVSSHLSHNIAACSFSSDGNGTQSLCTKLYRFFMTTFIGNPHGGLVFSTVWNNGTNDLGEVSI
jgi:hypothetical protein